MATHQFRIPTHHISRAIRWELSRAEWFRRNGNAPAWEYCSDLAEQIQQQAQSNLKEVANG